MSYPRSKEFLRIIRYDNDIKLTIDNYLKKYDKRISDDESILLNYLSRLIRNEKLTIEGLLNDTQYYGVLNEALNIRNSFFTYKRSFMDYMNTTLWGNYERTYFPGVGYEDGIIK